VRNLKEVALGRTMFAVGLLWLSALAVVHLWPASYWLEVHSVRVADSDLGQPIVMYVERDIHRDFTGTWGVSVRQMLNGKTHVACAASAVADYQVGSDLPEVITLGWWTNGRCETLPVGVYVVQTVWQVHGAGLLPAKTVHSTSNPFKVS
jgi:hypothetical protein